MRSLIGLSALLLLVSLTAGSNATCAQEKAASPCDWAKSQIEFNQCSADQYGKADARRNTIDALLMKSRHDEVENA
jgi:uncharacterized protein YecT (DUF1311 family)